MRHLLSVVAISFIAVAPSTAQAVDCVQALVGVGAEAYSLRFDPATPNSSQRVTITAGVDRYAPLGTAAVLQRASIDVTITGPKAVGGLSVPITCTTATIGPLLPGTYATNLFAFDPGSESSPHLVTTGTLTVTPDLSNVPTISNAGIAAVALLLSVAGWFALRRRIVR